MKPIFPFYLYLPCHPLLLFTPPYYPPPPFSLSPIDPAVFISLPVATLFSSPPTAALSPHTLLTASCHPCAAYPRLWANFTQIWHDMSLWRSYPTRSKRGLPKSVNLCSAMWCDKWAMDGEASGRWNPVLMTDDALLRCSPQRGYPGPLLRIPPHNSVVIPTQQRESLGAYPLSRSTCPTTCIA